MPRVKPLLHMLSPIVAVLVAGPLAATDVYKCTNGHGDVAFQDRPCAADAQQSQLHLADPAPAPPLVTKEPAAAAPAPAPSQPAPRPRAPLPALFVCQNAEDGTTYISENGTPLVRYVPLGTLGYPGKSLGQAYGPGGGSGISAPGVNKIPISTAPRDALATQLTAVQDICAPASGEAICRYLRKQYDEVEHKLKRAFNDERAVLEPRERQLDKQLDNCL